MTENLFSEGQACVICGSNQKRILFKQRFSKLSDGGLMDGYDVVTCQNCGFAFADNTPGQEKFDDYYRKMSKYEHQDHGGKPTEFETRQFPMLAKHIQQYISSPEIKIFEIGCANGGLLNAIKQLGYPNVLGMDPSPVCARNALQLYNIQVLTGSTSDITPDLGVFDFIILVAVLEHIRDIDAALKKLRNLLSAGGKLYIEVPDVTNFFISPDAPFQEFSIEHINFFSPISLKNLLAKYGFTQVSATQISYDQTDTHTGYAVQMTFQKEEKIQFSEITKDTVTEPALEKYILNSHNVEKRIHQTINQLIESHQPLIVWGVGTHTQRLLATSDLKKANIVAFVDSNPNYQNKLLNDVPIIKPEDLAGRDEAILVSSRIFQSEIVNQIKTGLGLKNVIHTLYEV